MNNPTLRIYNSDENNDANNYIEISDNLKAIIKQTGYKTLNSLAFLYWLVKEIAPNYILELGTGYGCSAIFMALANEKVQIISVDNYKMGNPLDNITIPQKNISSCGIQDRIYLIECDTRKYGLDINRKKYNNIEFVFMDASHNKDDLWREYNAFKDILSRNHIIVVDDYNSQNTDDFIVELSIDYEYCQIVDYHDGMAILATSWNNYEQKINDVIWRMPNETMSLR